MAIPSMIFTRRWLILFSLGAIPLLFSGVSSLFLWIALIWSFGLIFAVFNDRLKITPIRHLEIRREMELQFSPESEQVVKLEVINNSSGSIRLALQDSPPDTFVNDISEPFLFEVPAASSQSGQYHVTAKSRGDYTFGDIFIKIKGPMGLVEKIFTISASQMVKVYPGIEEAAKFKQMIRRGRLQMLGLRSARIQGVGGEFESLRDYLPDDEMRRIDWKASAHRGKLVSRQYEAERAQHLFLLIDAGRTMLAEVEGRQKLDYAINAALLLGYVAALSDDRVGLLVFSDSVETYIPPMRGQRQVYTMMEALHNLNAKPVEADYRKAFGYFKSRWKRRALVVCFTDIWDTASSRRMMDELVALQPKHLAAAVTLLDTKLQNQAAMMPLEPKDVYTKATADQVMTGRKQAINLLAQRGALVIDSPAEQLSAALVNRYLEVKERMML